MDSSGTGSTGQQKLPTFFILHLRLPSRGGFRTPTRPLRQVRPIRRLVATRTILFVALLWQSLSQSHCHK